MPLIDASHDLQARTLTLTAWFAAPVERVWQVYADARQLEKVWGPAEMPATFTEHALTPGGRMNYYMTGPDGQKYCGYWEVLTVDEPHDFTVRDGFADEDFRPNTDLPTSDNEFRFEAVDGGTRATYTSTFASSEGLQQVLEMGVIEGSTSAINQIDGLLAQQP